MARIPGIPVEQAPEEMRRAFEAAAAQYGKQLEPLMVTAHNPEAFHAYTRYEGWIARARHLDRRLKELAIIKVAALVGCPFCIDIGSAEARAAGISDEQLRALPNYRESDVFSPAERLVLDYAVVMTQTSGRVDESLFESLREQFDEPQLVELTAVIAWENYRSRFNRALGIESQGFSEGAYCVVPHEASPGQANP